MRKLIILAVVSIVAILGVAGTVSANGEGAETFTITVHRVTESEADVNPCSGAPGVVTSTFNAVFHMTENKNGVHVTGTATGDFEFVPNDPSEPTFTGKFTTWFGENSNRQNGNGTFTFMVNGTGSDGSEIKFHITAHFSVSASGVETFFEKPRCA